MKFWMVACLALWSASAWAADVVVESISGTGSVELRSAGKNTIAQEGDSVGSGGHVVTGDAVAVRLLYPNGTHLTLSARTDLEVHSPETGAPSGALLQGSISVAVPKTVAPAQRKFFIKTTSAVMGVRGTEFVVDHDAKTERTELHTTEGSVEVGKTDKDFESGKLARVDALHHLVAEKAGLGPVAKFDHAEFAKHRAERHALAHALQATKLRSKDEIAERRKQHGGRPGQEADRHKDREHGKERDHGKDRADRPDRERRDHSEKRERPGRRE